MKQEIKTTPDNIQELKENEIFVFGSNEAGIHGAGAAKLALEKFGATYKQGFGLSGNTFALPTKDNNVVTLSLDKIANYIVELKRIINEFPEKHFFITEIGCGLAGYTPNDIAPLFKGFEELDNISLPQSFINILYKSYIIQVYKMTDKDMKCRDIQYELGKKYIFEGNVLICNSGYHSCSTAQNCLNYYDNNGNNRLFLCEIEINGNESFENNQTIDNFTKIATDNITFIKELTNLSKEFNSGDFNSGNKNSGNWNSGDFNSGNRNSGDFNSGNRNSDDWNSGSNNSGNKNSGDFNSGDFNSGNKNSGNRNSGNRNSGNWNSGDWNSGNRNSGSNNSGNKNSGSNNSGNKNSGSNNSGSNNSGNLNSISNLRFIFNKPTTILDKDIYYPSWLYFNLNIWINENNMTEIEKENNIYYKTLGGYLKTYSYKKAVQESYNKATKEEQRSIEDLPNYDAEVLYEIFGIDRRKKN